MHTTVRLASKQDILTVSAFLNQAKLGIEGIAESIDYFLLMENEHGEIIATLGIEPIGTIGLLRSLAITATLKETDILMLFNQMMLLANEKTISTLYLASNKPESVAFFQMLGFRRVETEEVPAELNELTHVKHIFTVDNSFFLELKL